MMKAMSRSRLLALSLSIGAASVGLWASPAAADVFADTKLEKIKIGGSLELRTVKLVNQILDGTDGFFQIRVLCDRAFEVTGLYVTGRDTTASVAIDYTDAVALNNIFGPGFGPPTSWEVSNTTASATANASSAGLELMSSMSVQPLGIADGGSFDILGNRSPNTQQTRLSIAAVVETERGAANQCSIVVVDH